MPSQPPPKQPTPDNLLREDLPLPAAVVYHSRLRNNLDWMQRFADEAGVKLCPHGKTTMTPAFFQQQLATGAWGLTLATPHQVSAAVAAGAERVLLANQLVGRANMKLISRVLSGSSGAPPDFYCLVDSPENVHQLGTFFAERGQTLQVLLEIGVPDGRCGCRRQHQIDAVLAALREQPALRLAGVETYEGVIRGDHVLARIDEHLRRVRNICLQLLEQGRFDTESVILTGAGSAWYDRVADIFGQAAHPRIVPVIRPGCYLIHDQGIYWQAQRDIIQRLEEGCRPRGDLQSSLEVWAYVQSRPEPGMAVLTLGKRDVAFDAGLPQPSLHYRPGDPAPSAAPPDWQLTHIMDHHSRLNIPADADLRVGDILALSTSHPCLTFDKWQQLLVIDDQYNLIDTVATAFR